MNVGVLGGTFDPIHQGHLAIAEEVRVRLDLAEVLFVPAGQPALKTNSSISAVEHRVQMVRLAIAGKAHFKLSTVEVERVGPSYTVYTVAQLKSQLGAGNGLFFILGWDSLAELPQWKEPSRLVRMCQLVVVPRPGFSVPDINSLEAVIPGLSHSVIRLDTPRIEISASQIRSRVSQGLPIHHLVSEAVERYIREHGLYITKD